LTGAQTAFSAEAWGLGAAAAARFRPDVVHAHTLFFHTSLVAAAVARVAGVPLVLTLHLGAVDALPQPYRTLTRAYELAAGRALLTAATRIICVSVDVRRHALALGAAAAKLAVVPNGVDARRFAPNPPAPFPARERGGACRDTSDGAARGDSPPPSRARGAAPLILLSTGRLIFNKGQGHLLEAMAALRRRGLAFRLVLVGEGPLEGRLRRQAERLGLGDTVQFAGYRQDMPALLRAADVFVRPSLSEGMSLAVLEAMAAGLPVVATDVSGTRELLQNGAGGLIVPPGSPPALADALARLAADAGLRRRLGEAARARALAYDWEHVADLTLEELRRART
jgi:glycosyltransferase involved in cell wall biosynthesis